MLLLSLKLVCRKKFVFCAISTLTVECPNLEIDEHPWKKIYWTVRVINECYVYWFFLRSSINSGNDYFT